MKVSGLVLVGFVLFSLVLVAGCTQQQISQPTTTIKTSIQSQEEAQKKLSEINKDIAGIEKDMSDVEKSVTS
ncbi:MAG: hypothetical protein J4473_00905 [Candidatus Aenigmarchaeota archaeon]|nr:hypothetical protein [Candidatus Aenigmarchaeota archaeon]